MAHCSLVPCVSFLIGLSCLVGLSTSYGTGPPPGKDTYCVNLAPGHKNLFLGPAGEVPATLDAEPTADLSVLKVTLKGKVGGFIVQARDVNTTAFGQFSGMNAAQAKLVTSCGGEHTVGHSSPGEKTDVSFMWTAPKVNGTVTFVVSIVDWNDHNKAWVGSKTGLYEFTYLPSDDSPKGGAVEMRPWTVLTAILTAFSALACRL